MKPILKVLGAFGFFITLMFGGGTKKKGNPKTLPKSARGANCEVRSYCANKVTGKCKQCHRAMCDFDSNGKFCTICRPRD